MNLKALVRPLVPDFVANPLRRLVWRAQSRHKRMGLKQSHELTFWEDWYRKDGAAPLVDYYRKFMLAMGNVSDAEFFRGKVCVDIGCGPKGSLTWLDGIAKASIGVDPLAEQYRQFGIDKHQMIYLSAPAEHLPFPTGYVDVLFSMNSLDHVDDLPATCREIHRVIKPGGLFIGSLNLDEPETATEPWTLTENLLDRLLFGGWAGGFRDFRPKLATEESFGPYRYFFEPCPPEIARQPGPRAMWCRYKAVTPQPSHASSI
jgi:SAM-dependent methyltransferase